jgi:quercetin dioxygenase-like cupin family protein
VTAAEIQELLPLHALDMLEGDEAKAVERAVAADASLAAELASLRDAAYAIPVEPVIPRPEIEVALMASVGQGRYERFAARLSELLDLAIDPIRALLGSIERGFPPPEAPGVSLIHFEGGPAYAAADCGIVRVEPGSMFPWHTHLGEEHSLILSGRMVDHEGREWGPGDEYVAALDTSHDLATVGDEPVIFIARALNGIQLGRRPQS